MVYPERSEILDERVSNDTQHGASFKPNAIRLEEESQHVRAATLGSEPRTSIADCGQVSS
jgi:hypothetical protein